MTLDDLGERPRRRRRAAKQTNAKRSDERTKLTATYLNGIAVAIVAVGVLRFAFNESGVLTASGALWLPIGISVGLHIVALLFLRRYRGEE